MMSRSDDGSYQHHALVLPFPLQGHIGPLMHLSQHLASSSHGFRVTFVNTQHNHERLMKANRGNSICSNDLHMVGLSDGLPPEAERKASDLRSLFSSMRVHMSVVLEQLIFQINQSTCPLTCIIADTFMDWVPGVVKKLAPTPAYIGFHACSAAHLSFLYHIPLLLSSGQVNADGSPNGSLQKFSGIPGVVDLPVASAPWSSKTSERRAARFKAMTTMSSLVNSLDMLLFNSFTELENEAIENLATDLKAIKQLQILPVGPTFLLNIHVDQNDNFNTPASTGTADKRSAGNHVNGQQHSTGQLLNHDSGCMEWLQGRAHGSVLYIAFGTTAWLSKEQLHELALGIEASQVPFIWVLRSDLLNLSTIHLPPQEGATASPPAYTSLPRGFLERIKDRAYFTSWAPQTAVLSHPAVGAFLTHSGWNSTLEAIATGVPMLLLPDLWDQKFHAQQVIEQWEIGLPLMAAASTKLEDSGVANGQLVTRTYVEMLVRRIMGSEDGARMREKATKLSEKARLAVSANDAGSSYNNIQALVEYLKIRQGA